MVYKMVKFNFRACALNSMSSDHPLRLFSLLSLNYLTRCSIQAASIPNPKARCAHLTTSLNTAAVTDDPGRWDGTVSSWTRQNGQT
jgi:hypothetical protein